jgi:cellulose synthase operon protein C
MRLLLRSLLLLWLSLAVGCVRQRPAETPLAHLRRLGPTASDSEEVARWLGAELVSPGGNPAEAKRARARLDQLGSRGMLPSLVRAMDDELHGRLDSAPGFFLRAAEAARASDDPRAELVAWYAVHRALLLRRHAPGLWDEWKGFVRAAMADPLRLGWRARNELVDWWADEEYDHAVRNLPALATRAFGCAEHLRLAGPFGNGSPRDPHRAYAPEAPGPWPARWPSEPGIGHSPHLLRSKRFGCFVSADEPVGGGVFYAETYLDLPAARELLIAVQGALTLSVDDHLVLERDLRNWGVWPKFGVAVRLPAGRHRLLARIDSPRTSIRLLTPDGRPANVVTSTDPAPPYALTSPEITGEPNLLMRYLGRGGVVDPGDDLVRALASYLAYTEGQADVASVMLDPLVNNPARATGAMLTQASLFAERDPLFGRKQTQDLVHELDQRAVARDPGLWEPALSLALWQSEHASPSEAVRRLEQLSTKFPGVPSVVLALARTYGSLGWRAEHASTIKRLVARFPSSPEALHAAVEVYDEEGDHARVDALVARIRSLDPDDEIVLTRALEREDYDTALSELKRVGRRRPDRKDIVERLHDVMARAGNASETLKKLESVIRLDPKNGPARLELADARFAGGNGEALRHALVDALTSGASASELEQALDLVEGMTELEPYRLPARAIVEAWEKGGRYLAGTAARVLDYAAVWVKSDGSSRMLEHEIVRIQSAEAINALAEQRRLSGLVLHMRVIKPDGRVLEPEFQADKPTVTMPHLEVGDYIETEHITSQPGDGNEGQAYVGPHWFFREENVAYARSELVVISPKGKPLIVETRGQVPPPARQDVANLEVRRWRVESSPAAVVEPGSPPLTEFLPSVRVGWGVSLERQLRRVADSLFDTTPVDPRVVRIARRIVESVPAAAITERAKRLYRWVLANVEEGEEMDGRRVVVGKQGNRARAFVYLCQSLGIGVHYAAAKDRLEAPPAGPISRATLYDQPVLVLDGERGPIWLTVGNKYAPFGYLPAQVRDVPAYLLEGDRPRRLTTAAGGTLDGILFRGRADLGPSGTAKVKLVESFLGAHAMAARKKLAEVPENRRFAFFQSLLGATLRGARLLDFNLRHVDDLDSPLDLETTLEMEGFAQLVGDELVIAPPFTTRLGEAASLPSRQTALLVPQATYRKLALEILLPEGATLTNALTPGTVTNGDRSVVVADSLEGRKLTLVRTVTIPAGRIQPVDYPDFVQFARRADDAQTASVRVRIRR